MNFPAGKERATPPPPPTAGSAGSAGSLRAAALVLATHVRVHTVCTYVCMRVYMLICTLVACRWRVCVGACGCRPGGCGWRWPGTPGRAVGAGAAVTRRWRLRIALGFLIV